MNARRIRAHDLAKQAETQVQASGSGNFRTTLCQKIHHETLAAAFALIVASTPRGLRKATGSFRPTPFSAKPAAPGTARKFASPRQGRLAHDNQALGKCGRPLLAQSVQVLAYAPWAFAWLAR